MGTSAEKISVFVDMSTLVKINSKLVNEIIVESTGEKVLNVTNPRSIFLTNISESLRDLIIEILRNPEANYQYQVEQENVGSVIIEDIPKMYRLNLRERVVELIKEILKQQKRNCFSEL